MTARYVRPGLTTVRQPVRELGAMAADRLHELVTGAPPQDGLQVLSDRAGAARLLRLPDPRPTAPPTGPSTCDPHTV